MVSAKQAFAFSEENMAKTMDKNPEYVSASNAIQEAIYAACHEGQKECSLCIPECSAEVYAYICKELKKEGFQVFYSVHNRYQMSIDWSAASK